MTGVHTAIEAARIVPVVVLNDAADAVPLGKALAAGGLPVAEVTFRTDAALESIRSMAVAGDCLVGAGTVLTAAQVRSAVDAGARFIVSPGIDVDVVRECQQIGVPVFPGVATASEVMLAIQLGLTTVKLFPADIVGGPGAVKSLSGPFPNLRFMPTEGVKVDNLAAYLQNPKVLAVGGTWMVPAELITAGDWAGIESLTAAAVAAADTIRPRSNR